MPGKREARISQRVRGGRDVNVAGGEQTVITGGDHTVVNVGAPGNSGSGVPGLLPRDAPGFTGRDNELTRLAGLAGGGRVVVTAIGGTAGVGKTALAVHAAHQLLDEFPDGHLYADLRGYTEGQDPAEPGEVLQVFLRRLGVPVEEVPAELEERSGLLRQVLASRRVLMVLDNVRTEAQARPLLPGAGGSLVLVTSRSVLPGLEVDERISLDVLSEDEAAAMLAGLAGTVRATADPEAVAEVARLCGRLPLALRICGQLLAAHPAWPVARLVQMLACERDRLARLGVGDLQVRAAFEVSYRLLTKKDARLFRLLSLHPGPDFDVLAAAVLVRAGPDAARSALGRLAEAYLVTEDATGRFGMHDLLRLFAKVKCQECDSPAYQGAAQGRLIGHYGERAEFLGSCVDQRLRSAVEQVGRPFPSIREALAVFQAERHCLMAAAVLAARGGWDEQAWQLSESMAQSLRILRYFDDLLTITEAALAAARHAGNKRVEGGALINLGEAYRAMRRFEEAITSYQQALTITRETGDRRSEHAALTDLGEAYRQMRRFEEAITSYQQALTITRETGDRLGEGQTLNNLSIAYQGLRQFDDAIDYSQQALAIRRETGDRLGEGRTLNNLSVVYHEMRRFEEAITSYQQALEIFRETGVRHAEGETLNNLGNAYEAMRKFVLAASCWREAAAVMRDVGDHEEAARLEHLATETRFGWRRWRRRNSRVMTIG